MQFSFVLVVSRLLIACGLAPCDADMRNAFVGFSRVSSTDISKQRVVVETFLDFECPFSAKLYAVIAKFFDEAAASEPFTVEQRLVVHCQPWHSQAHLEALAVIGVAAVDQKALWAFVHAIYAARSEFRQAVWW